eukprot:TRINITY_DN64324_c0_g1_i1.p1 TRINITY_DN64324_c0_g1~~TRINITY_DN64324_c0_g1_i1.p1  ORF type:complete len:519 (-),score=61.13 TRINITY_DN64324_c0_g1_i1:44-1600(-)
MLAPQRQPEWHQHGAGVPPQLPLQRLSANQLHPVRAGYPSPSTSHRTLAAGVRPAPSATATSGIRPVARRSPVSSTGVSGVTRPAAARQAGADPTLLSRTVPNIADVAKLQTPSSGFRTTAPRSHGQALCASPVSRSRPLEVAPLRSPSAMRSGTSPTQAYRTTGIKSTLSPVLAPRSGTVSKPLCSSPTPVRRVLETQTSKVAESTTPKAGAHGSCGGSLHVSVKSSDSISTRPGIKGGYGGSLHVGIKPLGSPQARKSPSSDASRSPMFWPSSTRKVATPVSSATNSIRPVELLTPSRQDLTPSRATDPDVFHFPAVSPFAASVEQVLLVEPLSPKEVPPPLPELAAVEEVPVQIASADACASAPACASSAAPASAPAYASMLSWTFGEMHPMVTEVESAYIQSCLRTLDWMLAQDGGLEQYLSGAPAPGLVGLLGKPRPNMVVAKLLPQSLEAVLLRDLRNGSDSVFVEQGHLVSQGGKKIVKLTLHYQGSDVLATVCWDWDLRLEGLPIAEQEV